METVRLKLRTLPLLGHHAIAVRGVPRLHGLADPPRLRQILEHLVELRPPEQLRADLGDRLAYATALTTMEELRRPRAGAFALAATDGPLLDGVRFDSR